MTAFPFNTPLAFGFSDRTVCWGAPGIKVQAASADKAVSTESLNMAASIRIIPAPNRFSQQRELLHNAKVSKEHRPQTLAESKAKWLCQSKRTAGGFALIV